LPALVASEAFEIPMTLGLARVARKRGARERRWGLLVSWTGLSRTAHAQAGSGLIWSVFVCLFQVVREKKK